MKTFYSGFMSHAHGRYPGLRTVLGQLAKKAGGQPDLEDLLNTLNRAADAADALPSEAVTEDIKNWSWSAIQLRSHLLSYIVDECERFDRTKATHLASRLVEEFASLKAALFTTNYDRVIEHICESIDQEISDGFESHQTDMVAEWTADFESSLSLTKLHGSVTWYVDRASSPERVLRLDRGYPLPGPEFRLSRHGSTLEPLMIVPTLEKDTTQAPYNQLMTRLGVVLRECGLLIAIGTSLRDNHLIGAISYSADSVAVLVIDRNASSISNRLSDVDAATIDCDIERFLEFSVPRFKDAISAALELEIVERRAAIREFAKTEQNHLEQASALNQRERDLLSNVQSDEPSVVLHALGELRGVTHQEILDSIGSLTEHERPEIRSAACGTLGYGGMDDSVRSLLPLSLGDPAEVVRLEASLAIAKIGGPLAEEALQTRADQNPNDEFISSALLGGEFGLVNKHPTSPA